MSSLHFPIGQDVPSKYLVEPAAMPPASAHAKDDEFEDGALDGKWAWRNQGTATYSESGGSGEIIAPSTGGMRCLEQVAPTGDFTVVARGAWGTALGNGSSNPNCGIYVANNSNGKILRIGYVNAGGQPFNVLTRMTDASTFSTNVYAVQSQYFPWLKLTVVGTTITPWWSMDGRTWMKLNSTTEAISAHLGSVRGDLTRVGFFADGAGMFEQRVGVHLFRITEP